jgi:hypothetical protein
MSTKKRDLIPTLQNAINKLMLLSEDMAKLEYMDNNLASRRLKKDLAEFKETELKALTDAVFEVRREIIRKPKAKDGRQKAFANLDKFAEKVPFPAPIHPSPEDEETF